MRAYSRFLEEIQNSPTSKIYLGGSTPPYLGPADMFDELQTLLNPLIYKEKEDELKNLLAQAHQGHASEFSVSVGSSLVYTQVLAALTEPGDSILIESPTYDPFFESAKFLSLKVSFYQRTQNFENDLLLLRKRKKKDKVLVISNPNCPTGQMYPLEVIKDLAKAVRFLILDEDFIPLFTDGRHTHFQGELPKNVVTIGSFNKSCGLASLRLGWLRADKKIQLNFQRMGSNMHIFAPGPLVHGGIIAMKNWRRLVEPNLQLAEKHRGIVKDFAKKFPNHISHNFDHGFFAGLKCPKGIRSGADFSKLILKDHGIMTRDLKSCLMPKWIRFQSLHNDFPSAWKSIVEYF